MTNSEPHFLPDVHVVIEELVMPVHNVRHAAMSRLLVLLLTVSTGCAADDVQFVTVCAAVCAAVVTVCAAVCAAVGELCPQSVTVNSVLVAHRHGGEGELHNNTEDFKILIFSCG